MVFVLGDSGLEGTRRSRSKLFSGYITKKHNRRKT